MAIVQQLKNGSFSVYWDLGNFREQEGSQMRPVDLTGDTVFKCTDHNAKLNCAEHEPFFKCASHRSTYKLHYAYTAASSLMKLTLNVVDGHSDEDVPQAVTAFLNEEAKEMSQTCDGQWGPVEFDFFCQYAESAGQTQKFLCTLPCLHLKIDFLPMNTPGERQILTHLAKLFDSRDMADVCFAVKGQLMEAHSFVVASSSPVLSAKLESKAQDQSKVIDIDDVDPEVFEDMLRYAYTGKVNFKLAESLYLAADDYQIESLKMLCEEEIISKLTAHNAIHFLVLAFHRKSPKMFAKSLELLAKGADGWQHPQWMELLTKYPALFFPFYLIDNALK